MECVRALWTRCSLRRPSDGRERPPQFADELLETALAGGYPLAVARQSATRRDAWFQSYVMTMLQRISAI